jgi:hypothetical protein
MFHLRLIVGASLLEGLRWARQNLYALLILSPLVLGMTYFGVGRILRDAVWGPSRAEGFALAALATLCLVLMSLSRASAEIYHPRRPESLLDALPVAADTHLHAALARRLARTSAVGVVALLARVLAGGAGWDAALLAALMLFAALVAVAEVFAALEWIHWGHRGERGHAALAVCGVVAAAAAGGALLLFIVKPGHLGASERAAALAAGALLTLALYALARALHGRWRASDIEYAKRLRERERRGPEVEKLLGRLKASASVRAQLARDLRLTLRGFSSAVYAAGVVAALWLVVLAGVLVSGLLPARGGAGLLRAAAFGRVRVGVVARLDARGRARLRDAGAAGPRRHHRRLRDAGDGRLHGLHLADGSLGLRLRPPADAHARATPGAPVSQSSRRQTGARLQ